MEESGEVGDGLVELSFVSCCLIGLEAGCTMGRFGREQAPQEGAGGFFDWLEEDAGEEAPVVGCEGVGALGGEGGE